MRMRNGNRVVRVKASQRPAFSYDIGWSLCRTMESETALTPIVKSLNGAVKAPKNFDYDYKKLIDEIRTEKYL
jgi:hypothetical protein